MSTRIRKPTYIPPPTTFIISQSGVTYGSKSLPNKNWNTVREQLRSGNISQSTVSNGNERLPNSSWNAVREHVRNASWRPVNGYSAYDRNVNGGYDFNIHAQPNARQFKKTQNGVRPSSNERNGQQSDRQQNNRQPRAPQSNEPYWNNRGNNDDRKSGSSNNYNDLGQRHHDIDADQQIETQKLHYATPDFDKKFDKVDKINGGETRNAFENGNKNNVSASLEDAATETPGNDRMPWKNDVDWQTKEDRRENAGSMFSRGKKRSNSVYDPEGAKTRTQNIDKKQAQIGNVTGRNLVKKDDEALSTDTFESNGSTNESESWNNGQRKGGMRTVIAPIELPSTSLSNSVEVRSEDPSIEESKQNNAMTDSDVTSDDDQENVSESGDGGASENEDSANGEKQGKISKIKGLYSLVKNCAPSFAEKLLQSIEKRKDQCMLQFDDICKAHKEKNGKPIFTNYSCENGTSDNGPKSSIKKKLSNLVGGFYTRVCSEMEGLANYVDDWLDEVKPCNDNTWSPIEGEHGIRCVAHYENQIEDHAIYPCSCCFNEIIDRDAFVNVTYMAEMYGCCKPAVVLRSFENRPYLCERILASMSEKRREAFLKRIGQKHQMKGGVHCISVIPSMENLDKSNNDLNVEKKAIEEPNEQDEAGNEKQQMLV